MSLSFGRTVSMGKKSLENRLNELEEADDEEDPRLRELEQEAIDAFIAAFDPEGTGDHGEAAEAREELEKVNREIEEKGGTPFIEVLPNG